MAHNMGYLFGLAAGVLCGLIFILLFLKLTRTDGNVACQYDERQKSARGKGYQYGFFALVVWNIVYAGLTAVSAKLPIEPSAALLIGVFFAVAVMIACWIWNDAYFSLNERRPRVLVLFAVLTVINLLFGVKSVLDGRAVAEGMVTINSMNLVCAFLFLFIFLVLLAKHRKDVSNAESDEE